MLTIKKNDQVFIIAGKDKGKTGKVLKVFPKDSRLIVENINMVKKARRKTQQDQQGGISEIESAIHISNVMLVDKKTNQPTRFGVSVLKDGSKVRISKKSGEVI
ncbi:MAG: 50S ribosomal protein L24 [Omnitrophica WOR_2 bacterium GWF2_38_59]|nr:MAG: 50S ribosomal protein L24 [Omnitrophica WOR_2 bacterium GWA2_37_7]OGX25231.1 MAG: 50S ribosomal protein L24 [Omnitrophica WOR_2 bacterium GWF2_38_59]OGX47903.1 MAG: 50S ribosomal protein L24 [Omnitrophica WOR_2 bacterium RIFOXYA2_FULL_38_17]OGX54157.1 MAG: 50S ribosomal protein L24 [Omnitrophica WOR_2 bacterium RIFOXYA12_FULL_38_10]OGX56240.1 MAG: 50S ribosomal protein L24 [Omnitrophica WOR_2 bacterium RIFOXYC2_FULL_38_12]OGX60255.1 MAG: 50S ribosomal protein L24 [Omnitrophica WOR_2 ba